MEFSTKSGTTLAYDDRGPSGGPVVVLVHGHPFNRTMWNPQAEAVERAGHRVIVPDLRGYGESTVVPGRTLFADFADDIAALLDHLGVERAVVAGLSMAPGGIVMMLLSPVSAWITGRFGGRVTLITGTTVIAIGYLTGALLMGSVWQIVLAATIIGAGTGIAYAAMPALIMGAVPISETGAANGLNALMRTVGTSTSAAVMTVVLTSMTFTVHDTVVPTRTAFVTTFLIGAGAAVAALVLAAFIPRRTR